MLRVLALACTLLCAGCWVYRGGPNYQYEPVAEEHAWTIDPDLRQYSIWKLGRGPLRYRTDVWRYRHDMIELEVYNGGDRTERVRITAAAGATGTTRVYATEGKFHEVVPSDAWIDLPRNNTVRVRVMLEELRGSAQAKVGDRIRFRIEDSTADPGPVEFDFRLASIWRDYTLSPVLGR